MRPISIGIGTCTSMSIAWCGCHGAFWAFGPDITELYEYNYKRRPN
jgi:hypothetical protein